MGEDFYKGLRRLKKGGGGLTKGRKGFLKRFEKVFLKKLIEGFLRV